MVAAEETSAFEPQQHVFVFHAVTDKQKRISVGSGLDQVRELRVEFGLGVVEGCEDHGLGACGVAMEFEDTASIKDIGEVVGLGDNAAIGKGVQEVVVVSGKDGAEG